MRLDFNVLWVEDQPDRVAGQAAGIRRRLADEGFEFRPTFCRTIAEVQANISDHVFKDEVDLVMADWDLGGGLEGQQAIAQIRESIQYKDVIFYSANEDPAALRKLAFDEELEGIYCATRDGLLDEVIGVFQSLVKKVLDLDHARGIVMGATSDIDHTVNECLLLMVVGFDDAGKEAAIKAAFEAIDKRLAETAAKIEALRARPSIEALMNEHFVFNANDRLRMLSRALKSAAFKAHGDARPSVIQYIEEVVPERNGLAHKLYSPQGKPTGVANSSGEEIDIDQLRALRRTILGLRGDFRSLLEALRLPPA